MMGLAGMAIVRNVAVVSMSVGVDTIGKVFPEFYRSREGRGSPRTAAAAASTLCMTPSRCCLVVLYQVLPYVLCKFRAVLHFGIL